MDDQKKLELDWVKFKNTYPVGTEVSGKITYKAPYGVFLDIGGNFRVLLEIIQIEDLDYGEYQAGKQFCVGEMAKGIVAGFVENERQMRISQKI